MPLSLVVAVAVTTNGDSALRHEGDVDALALTTSDPDAVNVQLAELEAVLEDALL